MNGSLVRVRHAVGAVILAALGFAAPRPAAAQAAAATPAIDAAAQAAGTQGEPAIAPTELPGAIGRIVTPAAAPPAAAPPATPAPATSRENAKLPAHKHGGQPFHFHALSRLAKSKDNRGSLKLVYGRLSDADHRTVEKAFRDERVFEDVLDTLNQSLVLPRNLVVRLQECGEVNAFYDSNEKAVNLCYELFDHFLRIFGSGDEQASDEDREQAVGKSVAALSFAFYHELGHALIDLYDLPITGKEEDAVDQLATVMLLETWEGEDSELAILSSAEWFDLDAREGETDDTQMADEHSLDRQRYYNLVCWIYGSNPDYFADVAKDWELPDARAVRCADEYARMSTSWDSLLGPHLRPTG